MSLTYLPTPHWLRWLIRSALDQPVHALRDVNLQLRAGEICGVIGPNGAGKSTLFRVLMGLLLPTEGTASVVGVDTRADQVALHTSVGFVPADDRTLFLRYSCEENLQFHARVHGYPPKEAAERIDEVLARVDLTHARKRAAVALSSGMRGRLLLARALLHRPPLLILDEPTSPLDPVSAHDLIASLRRISDEDDVGVIISSHRMEDIESLPDRVILLDEGQIVYDGHVERLRDLHAVTITTITAASTSGATRIAQALDDADGEAVIRRVGDQVRIATDRPVGPLFREIGGVIAEIVTVDRTRPSLRDVMAATIHQRRTSTPHGAGG